MSDFDILTLVKRIEILLESGEGHFTEFKSAYEGRPSEKYPRETKDLCQDIARTLVAFANADGGQLLVGVEDDGTVTGINYSEEKTQILLNAPKTHVHEQTPLPLTRVEKVNYQGHIVLLYSVSKGTEYVCHTVDGRCLVRRDKESVPIPGDFVRISRLEVKSREYD
jgi:ATP-dependent DNA helicase RecG